MSARQVPEITPEIREHFAGLIRLIRRSKELKDYATLSRAFHMLCDGSQGGSQDQHREEILAAIEVARISVEEIGLGITSVISVFLLRMLQQGRTTLLQIEKGFGKPVAVIVNGLYSTESFNGQTLAPQAENFRNLLLNLAGDVRVILIKIARQLYLMRRIKEFPPDIQIKLAMESNYLYAPLAHRLGFYLIKSEMEDLFLKYTDRKTYDMIAVRLAQKMKDRRQFIQEFIRPVEESLRKLGFNFEIIGRPKSIHSIWNKMVNKGVDFEDIYDLFAIRIIIDSSPGNEKADCWKAYSAVTDIYQPNPQRLRDWISVPKTNGYESLHTTVVGPEGRWVEVQIRTVRMNEIAEKGFAAHWKYKGLESGQGLDEWMGRIREILSTPEPDAKEFLDDFRLSLYSKEIFVFTPRGDLRKFPAGATVLDFAYDIHSDMGSTCTGGKVNGKNVPIRHVLQNGDRVEIMTSKNQTPKMDWLNFVVTSKAKTKIRFKLNEAKVKAAETGKEMLVRRLKNWKIPFSDETVRKLLKAYKLKMAQDLYFKISTEEIDLAEVKDLLQEPLPPEKPPAGAETPEHVVPEAETRKDDFLIIDDYMSNVDYRLAKCCNPIIGDEIFGFITVGEGIKVHRTNCPNAFQLMSRYGYRVVKARWRSGIRESLFTVAIDIEGESDPGILGSISGILSKDLKINLQSFSMDSDEGMFRGRMKLSVKDTTHLESLISRLMSIRGVYRVSRVEGTGT